MSAATLSGRHVTHDIRDVLAATGPGRLATGLACDCSTHERGPLIGGGWVDEASREAEEDLLELIHGRPLGVVIAPDALLQRRRNDDEALLSACVTAANCVTMSRHDASVSTAAITASSCPLARRSRLTTRRCASRSALSIGISLLLWQWNRKIGLARQRVRTRRCMLGLLHPRGGATSRRRHGRDRDRDHSCHDRDHRRRWDHRRSERGDEDGSSEVGEPLAPCRAADDARGSIRHHAGLGLVRT